MRNAHLRTVHVQIRYLLRAYKLHYDNVWICIFQSSELRMLLTSLCTCTDVFAHQSHMQKERLSYDATPMMLNDSSTHIAEDLTCQLMKYCENFRRNIFLNCKTGGEITFFHLHINSCVMTPTKKGHKVQLNQTTISRFNFEIWQNTF